MRASREFQMKCPRCFTPITKVLNHECQRLYPTKKQTGFTTKLLRNAFPNASDARESQRKSLEKKARQLKRGRDEKI